MVELQKIATEQRNPNTMNIDTLSTLDMVKLINREDHRVAEAVAMVTDKIAEAVDVIAARLSTGKFLPKSQRGWALWYWRGRTECWISIPSRFPALSCFPP